MDRAERVPRIAETDLSAMAESIRTRRGSRQRIVAYLGELAANEQSGWSQLGRGLSGRRRPQQSLLAIRCTMTIRRATSRSWSISAAFGWKTYCAASATCGSPGGCGVCWAWTRCCQSLAEPGREEVSWPRVAVILDHRPILPAVERTTHRDDVVSRHGLGGLVGRIAGEGLHRPALCGLGLAAAAQVAHRQASERSPRWVVRLGIRPAVVRRDQHVFRGPMHRQRLGEARLFAQRAA